MTSSRIAKRAACTLCATVIGGLVWAGSAGAVTTTFGFTNGEQSFTVPAGVTSIDVVAIGAPGGTGDGVNPGARGLGARSAATLSVTPNQLLYIEVGGVGGNGVGGPPNEVRRRPAASTAAASAVPAAAAPAMAAAAAVERRTCGPCRAPSAARSAAGLVTAGGGGGGGGDDAAVERRGRRQRRVLGFVRDHRRQRDRQRHGRLRCDSTRSLVLPTAPSASAAAAVRPPWASAAEAAEAEAAASSAAAAPPTEAAAASRAAEEAEARAHSAPVPR